MICQVMRIKPIFMNTGKFMIKNMVIHMSFEMLSLEIKYICTWSNASVNDIGVHDLTRKESKTYMYSLYI